MDHKINLLVAISICILVNYSHQATQYCTNSYCKYIEGSLKSKIIISVPHGGSLLPLDRIIRTRSDGCWLNGACVWSHYCGVKNKMKCKTSSKKDAWTKGIALELAKNLKRLTGHQPHVIINELHRSKMDANRELGEATFYQPLSVKAYNEYHRFAAKAKASITGNGLFLDIHGQTHSKGWHEFGYLLSRNALNSRGRLNPRHSSIRALAARSKFNFDSIVRGSKSLGFYLEQQDKKYRSVPSPKNKRPQKHDYFSGGYNTKIYGSQAGGKVDAIQIEAHSKVRTRSTYKSFSKKLAKAIKAFMDKHY